MTLRVNQSACQDVGQRQLSPRSAASSHLDCRAVLILIVALYALADPVVRRRFADMGQEIPTAEEQQPKALLDLQKAEIDRWWPIIKTAGIKAE